MADSKLQVVIDLKDNLSSGLSKVKGNLSGFKETMEKSVGASKSFALGLAGVATGVGVMGFSMLKTASDVEQLQMSFTTMLGSAQKAQEFIKEVKDFARKTPLETEDISKASQTLLAFGINVKDVLPTVQMLGDVALGNKEKLGSLTLAFAQMQSAGKLMGGDLIQMVNAGFNPLQVISEKTGESMASLREKMSDGAISAKMVSDAFKQATSEGGRFFKGMENQSTTMEGMISTLKDDFKAFLAQAGEPLVKIMKDLLPVISGLVAQLPKLITAVANGITWFKEHTTVLYIVAGAITGALVPAIYAAATAFGTLLVTLAPFIVGGAIIAGLIAGIVWIVKNWDMLKEKALEVWAKISETVIKHVTAIVDPVIAFFTKLWDNVVRIFTAIWDFAKMVFEGIKEVMLFPIALVVGLVIALFDKLGIDVIALLASLRDGATALWDTITKFFSEKMTALKEGIAWAIDAIKGIWSAGWNTVGGFFKTKWGEYSASASSGMNDIKETISKYSAPIVEAFGKMWDLVTAGAKWAFDGLKEMLKSVINWVVDKINALIKAANKVAQAGAGALGIDIAKIPEIPRLAKGGIVNRPTLAMIGEDGPEAVVPLNKKNAPRGMGGVSVNIVVNGDVTGEELIERIGNELTRRLQLSTAVV